MKVGEDLFPLVLEVKQADLLAQSTYMREDKQKTLDSLREIYSGIIERGDCLSLRDLAVNGSDLLDLGIREGREVGDILAQMFEEVLNVPEHNDKEYLTGRFVNV